jgi:hypothetical protein
MTMSEATAPTSPALEAPTIPPVTVKLLLARINARLALLRSWLSHDHRDEPFWWARRMTASAAQRERLALKPLANLFHIERATRRSRLHGTQFKSLDEQRAWLDGEHHFGCQTRELVGLPSHIFNLQLLRGAISS